MVRARLFIKVRYSGHFPYIGGHPEYLTLFNNLGSDSEDLSNVRFPYFNNHQSEATQIKDRDKKKEFSGLGT